MEHAKVIRGKTLGAWKKYAEENYSNTPPHVLKYIIVLEEELIKLSQHDVSKSLPDHYAGELNTERIKAYRLLHEQYNLEEGTVRDIFCKGADWYKQKAEGNFY
jgi:hypothetical protein